jgi:acyl-coenzyme A synthetase/AMP-(fatty) acid ligase
MSALPRTQVLNSSTFKAPPLEDKSLCLPDFYDWQGQNSPNHTLFLYEDGPEKIRTISWAEAVRGIHRAAHLLASRVSPGDAAAALEGRPSIVALLASAGLYPTLPSVVSMLTPLTTS